MKTTTIDIDTLEVLLDLAKFGLAKQDEHVKSLQLSDDINDRNDRTTLIAVMNRGMRAIDKVEKKAIFPWTK